MSQPQQNSVSAEEAPSGTDENGAEAEAPAPAAGPRGPWGPLGAQ